MSMFLSMIFATIIAKTGFMFEAILLFGFISWLIVKSTKPTQVQNKEPVSHQQFNDATTEQRIKFILHNDYVPVYEIPELTNEESEQCYKKMISDMKNGCDLPPEYVKREERLKHWKSQQSI